MHTKQKSKRRRPPKWVRRGRPSVSVRNRGRQEWARRRLLYEEKKAEEMTSDEDYADTLFLSTDEEEPTPPKRPRMKQFTGTPNINMRQKLLDHEKRRKPDEIEHGLLQLINAEKKHEDVQKRIDGYTTLFPVLQQNDDVLCHKWVFYEDQGKWVNCFVAGAYRFDSITWIVLTSVYEDFAKLECLYRITQLDILWQNGKRTILDEVAGHYHDKSIFAFAGLSSVLMCTQVCRRWYFLACRTAQSYFVTKQLKEVCFHKEIFWCRINSDYLEKHNPPLTPYASKKEVYKSVFITMKLRPAGCYDAELMDKIVACTYHTKGTHLMINDYRQIMETDKEKPVEEE
ncbi:MAG: hypothetical protein CMF51_05680 [Legionellales bacterium]|nr:hypothetical protein [Legionellales bacterium]